MKKQLPQHVAIIMDGNGRWAEVRGRNRTFGHLRGARVAREIIEACSEQGINNLTLYTFSSENWLRPLEEVSFLMALLSRHLKRERANLVKNNIQFQAIGDLARIPESVLSEVNATIAATAACTGMKLTFALSYGGRQDILGAARKMAVTTAIELAQQIAAGGVSKEELQALAENAVEGSELRFESRFESHLQTAGLRDPDLIIRTSGESRLSNFFLWQSAYSEIYITPTLWPDYDVVELGKAFEWYRGRERRFGLTTAQLKQGQRHGDAEDPSSSESPASRLNSEMVSPQ